MAGGWDPAQYEKFRDERRQPFFDLLAMIEAIPGGRAVDLGCGTGELTRVLHESKKLTVTIGIDNSEAMLAKAEAFAGDGLRFKLGTFLRFAPQKPLDLVFSNAALQWAPEHEKLFERLSAGLAPGGQLAVQMPANHDHPSHVIADAVAQEEPFISELDGYRRQWPVQQPDWYAELLHRLDFERIDVRLQIYPHLLDSREDVVEWVKGTYLTAYGSRMSEAAYDEYLARYRERLLETLPDERPYLYTYKRILMHAVKKRLAASS